MMTETIIREGFFSIFSSALIRWQPPWLLERLCRRQQIRFPAHGATQIMTSRFKPSLGIGKPVVGAVYFCQQQGFVIAIVDRQAFQTERIVTGLNPADHGGQAMTVALFPQQFFERVSKLPVLLRKGIRVRKARDGFAEFLFQFSPRKRELFPDVCPGRFIENRMIDGMRAKLDALSAQLADFLPGQTSPALEGLPALANKSRGEKHR